MEKRNLEILNYEDKKTQTGKKFVRFQTSEGWMSSWDTKTSDALKEHVDETVCISVTPEDSKGFTNILKYLGPASEGEEKPSKSAAKPSGHATMYVSYAKDVFCALALNYKGTPEQNGMDLMNHAIKLVKTAKEEFEKVPVVVVPPKPVNVKKEITKILAKSPDETFEIVKLEFDEEKRTEAITSLLETGLIFESKPGFIRYLG